MTPKFEEICPRCGSLEVFYFSNPEDDTEGYECDNCLQDISILEMVAQQAFDNGRDVGERSAAVGYGELGY